MTKLKHYLFLVLGFVFMFGALIPYLIAWSIDTKDFDFWLRLAVVALAPLPFCDNFSRIGDGFGGASK